MQTLSISTLKSEFSHALATPQKAIQFLSKAFVLSLFIALSAKVSIPFWPVPMTMQAFSVLTIGLMASPILGLSSILMYILEGIAGLPVFQSSLSGITYLFGTTGGYILGFIPAIYVISRLKTDTMSWGQLFLLTLLGQACLYICGLTVLSFQIGFSSAIATGLVPFLLKIPCTNVFALFTMHIGKQIQQKIKS